MKEGCFEKMAIGWFNSNAKEKTSVFSSIDTEILGSENLYETSKLKVNRSFCRCIIPESKRKYDNNFYLYFNSLEIAKLDQNGDICDVIGIDYEFVEV